MSNVTSVLYLYESSQFRILNRERFLKKLDKEQQKKYNKMKDEELVFLLKKSKKLEKFFELDIIDFKKPIQVN